MNAKRRTRLHHALESIRVELGMLEQIRDDEQDYLDSMPESLQGTERAEKAQTFLDEIGTLIDGLEDQIETVVDAAAK